MARLDDTRQTFDYDKLLTISTGWDGCIYCLSPETAYLAALNLERFTAWRNRWHHTNGDSLTDEEWDNAQAVVAQGVYELMAGCDTLGADIRAGLETLASAILTSGGGGGSGCWGGNNPVFNCVIDLPNDELLGPGEYDQGNPATDPPPEGFDTWEEYFVYKCQAANFIWWLVRKYFVASRTLDGLAAIAVSLLPVFAGLGGLLPAAFTPAGFVAFITAIVGIALVSGLAWFFMDEAIAWWDANQEAIVCALYDSGTSVEAVSAIGNAIEDAIQAIVTWGTLSGVAGTIADLLGTAFSQLAGNGIVAPLFAASASVVSVEGAFDCDTCEQAVEGCYVFENDLDGFENHDDTPPPCGDVVWDSGEGHLANGSIYLTMDTGCDGVVARKTDPWGSPTVSQGDVFSVYVKGTGPDNQNYVFNVGYVGGSQQDYVTASTIDWTLLEITVDAGHAGLVVDFVEVDFNKALNATLRECWADEFCYVPV